MVQEPDNYYRKVAVPELGGVFSRIMAFKKGGETENRNLQAIDFNILS